MSISNWLSSVEKGREETVQIKNREIIDSFVPRDQPHLNGPQRREQATALINTFITGKKKHKHLTKRV